MNQPERSGSTIHGILKFALGFWALCYPIVSCAPLFAAGSTGAEGAAVGTIASVATAGVLFGPWIVGIIVLGVLVAIT